jgi:enediyne biosynthesis protein E5
MTPDQARVGALVRFAVAITILNVLGHLVLGFEVSVLQTFASVVTCYVAEIVLETIGAWDENRQPAFLGGGWKKFILFLLPAHITGMATGMLLYATDRVLPFIFGAAIAITSKAIFTVTVKGRRRHFLNPSNTGIVATVFIFPSVSVVLPYQFTEAVSGVWDWLIPLVFVAAGSFLNSRFTKKMPLILAWLGGFILQAVIRHFLFQYSLAGSLLPMTGVPFLLFTFYMVTDPQTSPSSVRGQIVFGLSLAAIYGVLMLLHVFFTIFAALFVLCLCRGILLYVCELAPVRRLQVSMERMWLAVARPAPLTGLPVAPSDMIKRVTTR